MAVKPLPDRDLLLQTLRYEPETGKLYWLERPAELFTIVDAPKRGATVERGAASWNKGYAGKEAFTYRNDRGYCVGTLFTAQYKAHRVIWKLVYGEDPLFVDHINMDRADNRLCNLRSITHAENCAHFTGPKRKLAA
jgi:hypothetical protein